MNGSPWSWVLLSGLAYLVPLPFVDDWLARRALRRALVLDGHADEDTLRALTEDRASVLVGCLTTMVLWPIKKLFKTVLWFLTVKEVLDRAALAAHVVSLARDARSAGWLPEHAPVVRDAMEVALGRTNWSPVTRVLTRQSRPPLTDPPETTSLGRLALGLRRHGGGALVTEKFFERARAELAAGG